MRKYFLIYSIVLACLVIQEANGQIINGGLGYYNEALKYSRTTFGGTARYMGLAGAATALGGDMGTIHKNPAGLGFYRRSEISGTPALNFASSRARYLNETTRDSRTSLNLTNFGAIFADPEPNYGGDNIWKGGAFGISFTRTNDFNNQYTLAGTNYDNSMTFFFADLAQGYHPNDYNDPPIDLTDLALLSYLRYYDPASGRHIPVNASNNYSLLYPSRQVETVTERGGQFQWDIGYGGNFGDIVFLGANLGIARIRNTTEASYYESAIYEDGYEPYDDDIYDFELYDYFETRGTGVNLSIGTIIVPADWIRFGLNFQTPTWYTMNEQYYHVLSERFINPDFDAELSTTFNTYRYHLTTPMRVTGGVALFADKNGFVSADVEYVDYSSALVRNPDDPRQLQGDNRVIQDLYRGTVNVSLGAEYRFDIYRLRSGFAVLGDPLRHANNINNNIFNFTVGGGVRLPDFYVDAALVHTRRRFNDSPYPDAPYANVRRLNTNLVVSVGSFF